jgi:predicted nucleic acid-binding protein
VSEAVIYLDSSAIVKLVHLEAESGALRGWLAANAAPMVTSGLARTETARALLRNDPAALPALVPVLSTMLRRPITDAILEAAAQIPEPTLRSLDAIHLATAEEFRPILTAFVAYDLRLAKAALNRGLPAVTPKP